IRDFHVTGVQTCALPIYSSLILPLSRRPMSNYNINKGIGRTVEFKGLKAQYLFIFAGGLLGVLVLVMVMYMAGVNSYVCLFIGRSEERRVGHGCRARR